MSWAGSLLKPVSGKGAWFLMAWSFFLGWLVCRISQ